MSESLGYCSELELLAVLLLTLFRLFPLSCLYDFQGAIQGAATLFTQPTLLML